MRIKFVEMKKIFLTITAITTMVTSFAFAASGKKSGKKNLTKKEYKKAKSTEKKDPIKVVCPNKPGCICN